ncbi:MAG: hypothetical protein IPM74_04785 [Crocinitomicaceae bacterium]|nr:hypothetical protein [Crocinitomicaceae bacterium]MBK8925221.1 hypothetical protein [Crocinitomicaceae bacterium]
MKTEKKIGIYMDHSHAHFISFEKSELKDFVIHREVMDESPNRSTIKPADQLMKKEQAHQKKYFEMIASELKEFSDVLLFGPTDAKIEFLHTIREKKNFNGIKFETKNSDKLTDKQQVAFVKKHFGV